MDDFWKLSDGAPTSYGHLGLRQFEAMQNVGMQTPRGIQHDHEAQARGQAMLVAHIKAHWERFEAEEDRNARARDYNAERYGD